MFQVPYNPRCVFLGNRDIALSIVLDSANAHTGYQLYPTNKETHNVFSLILLCISIDFYSNALVYWAKISHTNVIQDTEQRLEKTVTYVILGQYLLWPLCSANTVLHLLGMDRIKFCIRTCDIICHSTLDWVGPMIEVGVGGRVSQVRPKDVLWGSNPATLRAMAIH